MKQFRRWGWGLGIATTTAVAAFGVASWQANAAPPDPAPTGGVAAEPPRVSDPAPATAEPATGTGTDALTSGEVGRARAAALTPQLAASAQDVSRAPGPEYLSAEIVDGDTGRRADVYYYDYKTDKLVKQVVDLGTGKLAGSYAAPGLQLPPSEKETATAFDMLLADPLKSEFTDAYATATGKAFAGKDGLTVTAHVHLAKPADTGAAQCGKHRCLRLTVQTADGTFIDVNQIVIDLSGRTVARLT